MDNKWYENHLDNIEALRRGCYMQQVKTGAMQPLLDNLAEIAEHTKALERQAEASEEQAKIAREQAELAKQQAEQAAKEAKSSKRMALAAIIFSALTFLATLAGAIPGYIS